MAPDSQDAISYGIPTIKYKDKSLIHFAAFKDHLSIFPTGQPMGQLEESLSKYRTGKGTLQYHESDPIPDELIKEIVKLRLDSIN